MKKTLLPICLFFFLTAMVSAEVSSHYETGNAAFEEGNFTLAMKEWKTGAEQGDGSCINAVGTLYMGGKGTEKNEREAVKWFKRAVELGNEKAHANLALAYINGSGNLKADPDAAYALIKKVEDSEDPYVINFAGVMYMHGIGTPKNYEKALSFFKKIPDEMSEHVKDDIVFLEREIALQKAGVYDAKVLTTEVKKNQLRFDKQYKNKELLVRGFVEKVEQARNEGEGFVLQLVPLQNTMFELIECKFTLDEEDSLLALDKGNEVIVRGTYKGKQDFQLGSFVLFNCKIKK